MTEDLTLPQSLVDMDVHKVISKAINYNHETQRFVGKLGEILPVATPHGTDKELVILVGIGSEKNLTEAKLQNVGGVVAAKLNRWKIERADLVIEFGAQLNFDLASLAVNLGLGMKLKNYVFDQYFVAKKSEHTLYLNHVNILVENPSHCQQLFAPEEVLADGVLYTRGLITEPSNYLNPKTFADKCQEMSKLGLRVKILNQSEMKSLGMGALLGVAQGSINEPYMVIMEWRGGSQNPEAAPIAFIGKGVTFDAGGINLKTSSSISEMKYDMGGAGVVAGLMQVLARRRANVNAIGVLGLVENMPSSTAQRPSDVVTSMSGQTVEVDNTDAEGRLVLADALFYTQKEYKPKLMIDLATLTGAITVALGDVYAGLFSNNDEIVKQLKEAGDKTAELVWQLPMGEQYDKQINSEIADVKNTGSGRGAGSITAAQFLQRFVNNYPWAHLDIAGVTWNKQGSDLAPNGATGFGVRLLDRFIRDFWEGK